MSEVDIKGSLREEGNGMHRMRIAVDNLIVADVLVASQLIEQSISMACDSLSTALRETLRKRFAHNHGGG